jgi:hypothetical protein
MSDCHRINRLSPDIAAAPDVYPALAAHQRSEAWEGRELAAALQLWAERFNVEFKLDIPEIVFRLDRLPVSSPGQFRKGYNGFGLKGETAFNTLYMNGDRAPVEVLGMLLYGMLHAWQQAHGNPARRNHLNTEFRETCRSLGISVGRKGVIGCAADCPLTMLLAQYGIDTAGLDARSPIERPMGPSKLNKWSCGCTNVRVAVKDFRVLCLKCRQVFREDSPKAPSR